MSWVVAREMMIGPFWYYFLFIDGHLARVIKFNMN